ncbi:hypothetical protein tb265_39970 [Gemmatimonadetes bacterium T265]|nr:hypothetical protein tb265_39970 [Gemmatimonadetes bacterium T265]
MESVARGRRWASHVPTPARECFPRTGRSTPRRYGAPKRPTHNHKDDTTVIRAPCRVLPVTTAGGDAEAAPDMSRLVFSITARDPVRGVAPGVYRVLPDNAPRAQLDAPDAAVFMGTLYPGPADPVRWRDYRALGSQLILSSVTNAPDGTVRVTGAFRVRARRYFTSGLTNDSTGGSPVLHGVGVAVPRCRPERREGPTHPGGETHWAPSARPRHPGR